MSKTESAIVPWHMWGDTKQIKLRQEVVLGGPPIARADAQFARVSYARPDTWTFILAATIADHRGVIASGTVAQVYYDLTIGVGRSQVTLPLFRQFTWDFNGVPMVGQTCWSNSGLNRVAVTGGIIVVPVPIPTSDGSPSTIVAQDIQVRAFASLLCGSSTPGDFTEVDLDVSAFFAPSTHIRPEWFIHRFPGNEQQGT